MNEPHAAPPVWRDVVAAGFVDGFPGEAWTADCATEAYGQVTVEVPAGSWIPALTLARDTLDCDFFDWLTAVDELEEGFAVVAHVWSLAHRRHLLLRTLVSRDDARLPSATGVYRGANWHERETYEMFGVVFDGHPDLKPLLLPDGFEGHPLRKEFVLAARVAEPWPGAKEPGESDRDVGHGGPTRRRRMLPPGVPDDWGPQRTGQRTEQRTGHDTGQEPPR